MNLVDSRYLLWALMPMRRSTRWFCSSRSCFLLLRWYAGGLSPVVGGGVIVATIAQTTSSPPLSYLLTTAPLVFTCASRGRGTGGVLRAMRFWVGATGTKSTQHGYLHSIRFWYILELVINLFSTLIGEKKAIWFWCLPALQMEWDELAVNVDRNPDWTNDV